MGYPTKIQLIKRQKSEQWYINLPSAIAKAMNFQRGEIVEWLIEDKQKMVLMRSEKAVEESKKKPKTEP
jgi:antitoxin component of MazEF toxin-antitoxin module